MKSRRYRVVVIGNKSPTMLSEVTKQLSSHHFSIESISSLRLGHSFIILLMVDTIENLDTLKLYLNEITKRLCLQLVIDECTRKKYKFIKSNVFIRIRGNKIDNIKPYIISELTQIGLDIHGLESESEIINKKLVFTINIKGQIKSGLEILRPIADQLERKDLDVTIAKAWELLV